MLYKVDSTAAQRMVSDPRFISRMHEPVRFSDLYDVPYLAGYSKDGHTIYFDRHLKPFMPNGFDTRHTLVVHEKSEKTLIDIFHLDYEQAHHIATHLEDQAVKEAGVSWRIYSKFLEPQIKGDDTERITKPPPDLDLTPYRDEHDPLLRALTGRKNIIDTAKRLGGSR